MNIALRTSLLLCFAASTASLPAAVIGLWSFEGADNTAFRTDSINGGLLAKAGDPVQTTILATGNGSAFPTTIPSTGASNASFATFNGSNHFAAAYDSSYNVGTQFTVEFYFNATTVTTTGLTVASQWETSGNQRAWLIAVNDGQLRLGTSSGGTSASATVQSSTFSLANQIQANTDYYGAAVYNAGSVTFYLQNLSTPGELLTSTVTGYASTLFASSTGIRIGAYNSTGTDRFAGAIDEVRVSNTALTPGQLMNVPEPSAVLLLSLGSLLALRRKR